MLHLTETDTKAHATWPSECEYVWNEFMTPLLFLQSREQDVILQEVSRNIGQFSTDWTALFPMLMLGVAPLMIFYIFMQKYIIAGVSAGAVKG